MFPEHVIENKRARQEDQAGFSGLPHRIESEFQPKAKVQNNYMISQYYICTKLQILKIIVIVIINIVISQQSRVIIFDPPYTWQKSSDLEPTPGGYARDPILVGPNCF